MRGERLLDLIDFALQEGRSVMRTLGGHFRLSEAGCASIYTASTAREVSVAARVRWGARMRSQPRVDTDEPLAEDAGD